MKKLFQSIFFSLPCLLKLFHIKEKIIDVYYEINYLTLINKKKKYKFML